jgi:hypothetical protein
VNGDVTDVEEGRRSTTNKVVAAEMTVVVFVDGG